jgi:uncharacterized protein
MYHHGDSSLGPIRLARNDSAVDSLTGWNQRGYTAFPFSAGDSSMLSLEQARQWYEEHDTVHGFDHVLRVLRLVEILAAELGGDTEILHAAALLHDSADAAPIDGKDRASHELTSADFARQVLHEEGWSEERIEAVKHCIRAHRFRSSESPQTLEAKILFDADKLDVVGAFGVARTLGYAQQAGQPLFAEPSPRHIIERLHTEPARCMAIERFKVLEGFFEQLASEARGEP